MSLRKKGKTYGEEANHAYAEKEERGNSTTVVKIVLQGSIG